MDISSGQLLVGNEAREHHFESGGHPADVHELGALSLKGSNLKVATPVEMGVDWNQAPVTEIIDNARWVFDIVKRARSSSDWRTKDINHDIVIALNRLGLGPSYTRIYRHDDIGSMEKYYELLRLENFHRVGHDFSPDYLIEHLRTAGKFLRRRPMEKDIARLWKRDPDNNPHPEVYAKIFASFGEASEEAGFVVPKGKHWDKARYLDWGLKFRIVNDGLPSDYRVLRQLSRRGYSPSESGCIQNFGNLASYNQLADEAYQGHQSRKEELLQELVQGLDTQDELFKLFIRSRNVDDVLEAYVKFRICQETFSGVSIDHQVSIASQPLRDIIEMADHVTENSNIEALISNREYTYFVRRPKLTHQQLRIKGQHSVRPVPAGQIFKSKPEWQNKLSATRKYEEALALERLKSRLQEDVQNGELPLRLLKGAATPDRIISRFSRFQIVRSLLPHVPLEIQIQICKPDRTRNGLIELILKYHPSIDPKHVNRFIKTSPYSPYIATKVAA